MKELDLTTLGVVELNENEMQKIDGGFIISLFGLVEYDTKTKEWTWFWQRG